MRDTIAAALNPQGATGSRPKENWLTFVRLFTGRWATFSRSQKCRWILLDRTASPRVPRSCRRREIGHRRAVVAEALALMRQRNDDRTVAIAVPTHKLGDEQALSFNALPRAQRAGLNTAVWRGREAPDPQSPGEAMRRTGRRFRTR